MTAPAQPPDPRVQRVENALHVWRTELYSSRASKALARVLVEELGGRERDVVAENYEKFWSAIITVLDEVCPDWTQSGDPLRVDAEKAIRQLAAQQRENAETIQALRERVETAEAANTELDHARKSAEQSARDLRENNATLRAELDAIKGAQPPVRWMLLRDGDFISTYDTELEAYASQQRWRNSTVHALFTHPVPALPVVGTMKVTKRADGGHAIVGVWDENFAQSVPEAGSYNILLGAPLTTEGGK